MDMGYSEHNTDTCYVAGWVPSAPDYISIMIKCSCENCGSARCSCVSSGLPCRPTARLSSAGAMTAMNVLTVVGTYNVSV